MKEVKVPRREPSWMRFTLLAAGLYNLAWGAATIAFPSALFHFAEMEIPRYPQIWQCVGMIVGVYGIGYLIAATDPLRHWPITLVGLLGKVLGPIGFCGAVISGDLPLAFGITIISNDLIWWVPFAAILYQSWKASADRGEDSLSDFYAAITSAVSHRGATLSELSWRNRTLVVFLRHTGCTFCRETLSELAQRRAELESRGLTLALVHMSEPMHATQMFSRYGLGSLHRFSDPDCQLYRSFGLERGTFLQLFGPRVWLRGIAAALFRGHGIGKMSGDGFRLAGAFVLDRGKIVSAFRASDASERPEYLKLACGPTRSKSTPVTDRTEEPREFAEQLVT